MGDVTEQALYLTDHYAKEFEAEVLSVKDGKYVVLSKTLFYPASGGQPNDTGTLETEDGRKFNVVFAIKVGDNISHEVETEGLKEGDKVKGKIDWERRYTLMRMHTASHILSSVFHKEAGALITGNQLGTDKSRIDFSLDDFDRDKIEEYTKKANELIKLNKRVKVSFVSREEAMKIPGVMKLAGPALPPEIKTWRLLEIEDIDLQADGGTHVASTSEVGEVKIVKIENKGKNNRRVYFELVD